MVSDDHPWSELKGRLSVGSHVRGTVKRHAPFGFFVSITDIEFDGLVQITDIRDEGVATPSDYPAIGERVVAIVLGFKETGRQIWLGIKPSHLGLNEEQAEMPPISESTF